MGKAIVEFVGLIKKEKESKIVKVLGTSFNVFPEVFSPVYSSDTSWFAEKIIPLIQKKTFLEIGSGAGVVACLAAMHGAINVIATDINPHAINNILSNAQLHSLLIDTRLGSVFDPIADNEVFDVIFWNHPFYYLDRNVDENDAVCLSVYDVEYQFLKKYFFYGKEHLSRDGQLILGTSNVARINVIKRLAKEAGYSMCLLEKTQVPVFKERKIKMDLRLYSFKSERRMCKYG